jgi:enamine deaminase RidA (YjgF/YER057c/UK114 family)
MPPSGVARDAPADRAAGRTTKGRVAYTRMARRTEMKMVRTSIGMAEMPPNVPFEIEVTAILE